PRHLPSFPTRRSSDLAEPQDPDPFVLALAVDALPPVVFSTGHRGWAPTVELTWHLRALPAPGWLTVYGSGRLIADGWFDEEVERSEEHTSELQSRENL